MPAKSSPQILSFKNEHVLLFLNCLLVGLYNSSTNYWFSELIPVPL